MKRYIHLFALSFSLFFILWAVGCNDGNGGGGACPETNLDIEICDPETGGPFTTDIDNDFFPVVPESESVLESEDGMIRLEITVLEETEEVSGVDTRILVETELEDGVLIEVSRNFFAQTEDGTVCYFGEDVDVCDSGLVQVGDEFLCNGEEPSHEGAWRAGENGNVPGIIMPADPQVGDVFMQEGAPGVAEDQAEVLALGGPIEVPAGDFDDTLTTEECNPLEGGARDLKVYVRGIGLAIDEDAELVSFE
jgi:hypothetical protein